MDNSLALDTSPFTAANIVSVTIWLVFLCISWESFAKQIMGDINVSLLEYWTSPEFFKVRIILNTFFLEAHLPPPGYRGHRAHNPGSASMSYRLLKLYFQIIPASRINTYYKLRGILLTYFKVIFLTITIVACGVALLPVSVASSCSRTPRSLCSTSKPVILSIAYILLLESKYFSLEMRKIRKPHRERNVSRLKEYRLFSQIIGILLIMTDLQV